MNAEKYIAAAAVFVAGFAFGAGAFAAELPLAAPAAPLVASAAPLSAPAAPLAAAGAVVPMNQSAPTLNITPNASPSRAAVKAEAVEFVKNHKTPLAVQLEQYKH
jgi:hypothetical protein